MLFTDDGKYKCIRTYTDLPALAGHYTLHRVLGGVHLSLASFTSVHLQASKTSVSFEIGVFGVEVDLNLAGIDSCGERDDRRRT